MVKGTNRAHEHDTLHRSSEKRIDPTLLLAKSVDVSVESDMLFGSWALHKKYRAHGAQQ
jgi:hypothetical protein